MISLLSKATLGLSALALSSALDGSPQRDMQDMRHRAPALPAPSSRILMIRVSQESSPGAGDFDTHILGFIQALQTTRKAADFYMYGKIGTNYGNTEPALASNTAHVFFVNAADGVALCMVLNNTNHAEMGYGGSGNTQWELSGGSARVLVSDDNEEALASEGGTVFTTTMGWDQSNTDGMVIGALPIGFTMLGQFIAVPTGLSGGWVAISADGTRIPLSLVAGQRVRLDVALQVQVHQDH